MKQYITLKAGYSHSRMYGLTQEYFTTIIIDGKNISSVSHSGMYGSEERVNRALKAKGYEEKYVPTDCGEMPIRKAWNGFVSEKEAIEQVAEL